MNANRIKELREETLLEFWEDHAWSDWSRRGDIIEECLDEIESIWSKYHAVNFKDMLFDDPQIIVSTDGNHGKFVEVAQTTVVIDGYAYSVAPSIILDSRQ